MAWKTSDLADHYKRQGSANPIAAACESGRRNKYGVSPAGDRTVDGVTFASKAEMRAYQQLRVQASVGEIRRLKLQPRFMVQEAFKDSSGVKHRAIEYIADFSFERTERVGTLVVVDVKGHKTPEYRLKKKLLLKRYPEINFEEWK